MGKSIDIPKLNCKRCGHSWVPRKRKIYTCPRCNSPKWNEKKSRKEIEDASNSD